jgi:AraC-like DNA-binding protein
VTFDHYLKGMDPMPFKSRIRPRRGLEVILIAPRSLASRIIRRTACHIRYFASIDEFERWRIDASSPRPRLTLQDSVYQLILEIHGAAPLHPRLQIALAWLGRQDRIPLLKVFSSAASSQRSFYRTWSASMGTRPSEFLARLRVLFARRLLRGGTPVADILDYTGLKSLSDLPDH